jgi:hypothetical protein
LVRERSRVQSSSAAPFIKSCKRTKTISVLFNSVPTSFFSVLLKRPIHFCIKQRQSIALKISNLINLVDPSFKGADALGGEMQAPFELNHGEERLRSLLSELPPSCKHWNEANNRFQFIDRLLTECLGWQKPDISVEVSDGTGGKADYILGTPPKAVLEAKREAKIFKELPSGNPSNVRKLEPLMKVCSNFKEAVHQVIPYCALMGVRCP